MIWHFNNTTVRNPRRYIEALRAYNKHGPIEGLFDRGNTRAQKKLYNLILDAGVINSDVRDSDWNGRKWRLGFKDLGLIAYQDSQDQPAGAITKSGKALLNAKNEAELQDVYFRIIYNLEIRKKGSCFRPIPLILSVIKLLKESGARESINLAEFSVTLQDYREKLSPEDYYIEIIQFRELVEKNRGKIKDLYENTYKKVFERNNRTPSIKTISREYPDVSFRILELSGLFRIEGSKFTLNPQYSNFLSTLCLDNGTMVSESSYYQNISNLPDVPIDKDRNVLESIINENFKILRIDSENLNNKNIHALRLLRIEQEDRIRKETEERFAYEQMNKVQVIAKWFECLSINKSIEDYFEDEFIKFRGDERPQYLEWIVWRAFLAINNLSNRPYESRKFPLDGNLKPTYHAPSKGPDLLMEFDEFTLVIEVTWTTSSRQVATEGEPVIRHVAEIARQSDKPTYCLFLAPKIDINTVESYRANDKYFLDDGHPQVVNIICLSLYEFFEFFKEIPKAKQESIDKIYSILQECTAIKKTLSATNWKNYISEKFLV